MGEEAEREGVVCVCRCCARSVMRVVFIVSRVSQFVNARRHVARPLEICQ